MLELLNLAGLFYCMAVLNRQTFKALPTLNLNTNEVKLISSQAGSALNV